MKIKEENLTRVTISNYDIQSINGFVISFGDTKQQALQEYIKDIKETLRKSIENVNVLELELKKAEEELKKSE